MTEWVRLCGHVLIIQSKMLVLRSPASAIAAAKSVTTFWTVTSNVPSAPP